MNTSNPLFWAEECRHISNITEKKGVDEKTNNDPACFIRYCEMQKAQAEKAGFYDSAEYIQQCIDEVSAEYLQANGWDWYEYNIACHYLPYLINGDASGLSDEDIAEFNEWYGQQNLPGGGHWSDVSNVGFTKCEISHLFADCQCVRYMFKVKKD